MNHVQQIVKHFREVHYGVNWTWSNMRDTLKDVTWQQANKKIYSLNTILALVYHIHYYVKSVLPVFEGGILDASDKFSFAHPVINSQEEWDNFIAKVFSDADRLAVLIENLPEEKLWDTFCDEKYGNYYRNLNGIIEHCHYHLGQIAVIKKIIQQQEMV
jgi:hypothetical protein